MSDQVPYSNRELDAMFKSLTETVEVVVEAQTVPILAEQERSVLVVILSTAAQVEVEAEQKLEAREQEETVE